MAIDSAVLKNVTFHGYLDPSWIRPAVGWHAGNPGAAEGANTLEYMAFGERRKRKRDDLLCHTSAAQSMPIDIPTWMGKSAVVVTLPAVCLQVSLHKTVDNSSADNLGPEPRRCMVFQDQDSATMASEGSAEERNSAIANIASQLFGVTVNADNVIPETIEPVTEDDTPIDRPNLQRAIEEGVPTNPTHDEFSRHPIAAWVERNLSQEEKNVKKVGGNNRIDG